MTTTLKGHPLAEIAPYSKNDYNAIKTHPRLVNMHCSYCDMVILLGRNPVTVADFLRASDFRPGPAFVGRWKTGAALYCRYCNTAPRRVLFKLA